MAEEVKKEKMSHTEKLATNTQKKLENLRKKVMEKPPKTWLGKKMMSSRLTKLEELLDKRILRNDIENLARMAESTEYDMYEAEVKGIISEVSEILKDQNKLDRQVVAILEEQEKILAEIESIKGSNAARDELLEDTVKYMDTKKPKGYIPKEPKEEKQAEEQAQETPKDIYYDLQEKYKEYERQISDIQKIKDRNQSDIEELNKQIDMEEEFYDKNIEALEYKKERMLVATEEHPIKDFFGSIGKFFKGIGDKVNNWIETKRKEANESLESAVKNSEEPSHKEVFRANTLSELSLEEQKEFAKSIQERVKNAENAKVATKPSKETEVEEQEVK